MRLREAVTVLIPFVLATATADVAGSQQTEETGRPVHILSIGFPAGSLSLDEVVRLIDREAGEGTDLIILPETLQGQYTHQTQGLDGDVVATLSEIAKEKKAYIVCPIDRQDGTLRLNSAVLIDRNGIVAGVYDKVYPYWSEFDLDPPVEAGSEVPVFETDFGRLGIAICFDVNFPEVWRQLAGGGAELVVWPSAYSAGTSLQAHAINHHYYIVTSSYKPDCIVYDITGEEILYERGTDVNVSRITLDLDRGIYHQNFNMDKQKKLLQDHGDDVEQEKWMDREQWFVLRAKRPGVSARDLAKSYGMEELRDYIDRSRHEIDRMRDAASRMRTTGSSSAR